MAVWLLCVGTLRKKQLKDLKRAISWAKAVEVPLCNPTKQTAP